MPASFNHQLYFMRILLLFLFSFFFSGLRAQITGAVSGTVKDNRNEPLPRATVRLFRVPDSLVVQTGLTGENGRFQFGKIQAGTYRLSVTSVGKRPFSAPPFRLDAGNSSLELPVMVLVPASGATLTEVVVKAKKPLVEQELDKTVVNVSSMISSASSNTLEVLEKTPGITVSPAGDISLNGRSGILVMIDGRPTYMSGPDLAAYLKSLPGGLLEKIELIDNPPARYDANGNGIINIRLKKNRAAGYVGSITSGFSQGRYARNNQSASLTYNRKKLNIYTALSYAKDRNYTDDDYQRSYYKSGPAPTSTVSLLNNQLSHGQGVNASIGGDYALTANTTVGLQLNWNHGTRRNELGYDSRNFNARGLEDTLGEGGTLARDNRTNFGSNINFVHRYGNSGRELSADLNYLDYTTRSRQNVQNRVFLPSGDLYRGEDYLYVLPSDIHIYTAKADYVHPLPHKARLEAGLKTGWVDQLNPADYYNIHGSVAEPDYQKSNHFRYRENIHAAYVNTQKTWKRLSAQLGFRVENTHSRGIQDGNLLVKGSRFTKDYTDYFPSVFVGYKLDTVNRNSLSFSITRRINRPNYQQLNPFLYFRDNYSYYGGNPLLTPQFQNRYELCFQHRQYLRFALSYNRFSDIIFQTTEAVGDLFVTRPHNVSKGHMLLLNTGLSLTPAKWWNFNTDILLSHIGLNGQAYTEKLDPQLYLARINVLNQLTFPKGWSGELGGYFASADLSGQTETRSMFRVNAGMQKKFWKDRASIRLSADDIFRSWVYHNKSISIRQAQYYQVTQTDTRRAGLAFSYRFGKEELTRKRRHINNASDEEKGRID